MQKGLDELIILLDESGSMYKRKDETLKGLKALLEAQVGVPDRTILVSFFTFSAWPNPVVEQWHRRDARLVPDPQLHPGGNTALYDACCEVIDRVGRNLDRTAEEHRPEKVIFTIITDGEENSSKKFKKADVLSRIAHQQSVYKWIFHFVGPKPEEFADVLDVQSRQLYNERKIGETYSITSAAVKGYRIS